MEPIRKPKKWEEILKFSAAALCLLLLNLHAGSFRFEADLTEDNRYTLSPAAERILDRAEDDIYIEVYLDGELNASFKRLQKNIRQTLERFQSKAGSKLQYKFINPDEADTEEERNRFRSQLVRKGMQPTQLFDNDNGRKIVRIIFPYALVYYKKKQIPILLLKGNLSSSPEEQLNQSIESLEYELADGIRKLTQKRKPVVAFTEGHGEFPAIETADLQRGLEAGHEVRRINLKNLSRVRGIDALIVAGPTEKFAETELYKLDQYVMNGGKVLFFADFVQMNIDSIAIGGTYAFSRQLGLTDLLFKYGARPNTDLIMDTQMGSINLNVGNLGNRPNIKRVQWPYYVVLNRFAKHPISRNINGVYAKFVGTIDTVFSEGIRKTPLLFSNKYSRVRRMPGLISLDEVKNEMSRELFNRSYLPTSILLEGNFNSMFKNRFPPRGVDETDFRTEGKPAKILISSDADIVRNEIDPKTGEPLPLGFERQSGISFGNKDFVINALTFMLDDEGLILARSNEVKMRPLDAFRTKDESTFWQALNLGLPVVLILLFGYLRYYLRKRKYSSFHKE